MQRAGANRNAAPIDAAQALNTDMEAAAVKAAGRRRRWDTCHSGRERSGVLWKPGAEGSSPVLPVGGATLCGFGNVRSYVH